MSIYTQTCHGAYCDSCGLEQMPAPQTKLDKVIYTMIAGGGKVYPNGKVICPVCVLQLRRLCKVCWKPNSGEPCCDDGSAAVLVVNTMTGLLST